MIIEALRKSTTALGHVGLVYVVGDESLLGLAEGDLEKYRFNVNIYLLPVPMAWLRYIVLAVLLIFQGITVKPKIVHGRFRLKLRQKKGLLKKASNFISLIPMKRHMDQFRIMEQGRQCTFNEKDLSVERIVTVDYQGVELCVPVDLSDFVETYRTELLSGTYRKHTVELSDATKEQAETMLFDISEILNASDNHWWLEGGTLLGLYRDGKLLDWDHDIDLGIRYENPDHTSRLIKALKNTPYYVRVLDFPEKEGVWNLGSVRMIKIFPRKYYFFHTELCLDLFFFYREPVEGTEEPVYKYVVHQRNGYHSAAMLDELTTLEFKGHKLGCPVNVEPFLASKYGENWRTPVKEWHVAVDDKTILNNH